MNNGKLYGESLIRLAFLESLKFPERWSRISLENYFQQLILEKFIINFNTKYGSDIKWSAQILASEFHNLRYIESLPDYFSIQTRWSTLEKIVSKEEIEKVVGIVYNVIGYYFDAIITSQNNPSQLPS